MVDEGKERLNPSREKHCRRKVEKSCVTPAGTSTHLTSRISRMTTHIGSTLLLYLYKYRYSVESSATAYSIFCFASN